MNRNFKGIWIPQPIWVDSALSIMEKIFLVEINSLDNGINKCFASNKYFSEFFEISKSRCSQIITSLAEKKYIKITIKKQGKQITHRTIKVVNEFNRVVNKLNPPIKYPKHPYLINYAYNNMDFNNKNINNIKSFFDEIIKLNDFKNYMNDNNLELKSIKKITPKQSIIIKKVIEHLNLKMNKNYRINSVSNKNKIIA